MAGLGLSENVNIDWPLVVGLGVVAAVIFYALYIVNGQLNALDTAASTLSTAASNAAGAITSPLKTIQGWFDGTGGSDE
jgi:hypothetical protein